MNARRLHLLLWAFFFLLIEVPARSCGPDWPQAVFVKKHGPDAPYQAFAAGRLGVPQPGYRTRHLVIAYRYLSGLPLSLGERSAAVSADKLFNATWDTKQQSPQLEHAGFLAWVQARKAFGPVDGFLPENPFGTEDAWNFDAYFENCLDDAFGNATRTFGARSQSYGSRSPDVVEWVRGQDAVFHNCGKDRVTPTSLPPVAPEWLRFDRAYQQAAALLYQGNFDNALIGFSAIAANPRSPWSVLARYLVGRVMVKRAVQWEVYLPPLGTDPGKEPTPDQRLARYVEDLRASRAELLKMRAAPRMQPLAHAVDAMLDRVNARLEPERQTRVLAMRLTAPAPDPNFYQDVLDLSYLLSDETEINDSALSNRPKTALPPPATEAERRAVDMIDWIGAFHTGNQTASAQHWQESHNDAWLLAALTFTRTTDAGNSVLLEGAAAIQPQNPSYAAVQYQRLRLSASIPAVRNQLLGVTKQLSADESMSTRNLFAELNARSAPDLDTWLTQAGRRPAAEAVSSEEDALDPKPVAQPCGPMLSVADTPLFAPDAATVLNTRLPLRLLAQAAEGTVLPPNLRFQVAQAAWTRAVLLNRRDIAMRLSPILIRCNARWQPVLSAFNRATSAGDQKAAALFALMRFASTEPDVREGNYRVDGFASYSVYRDNWWCFTVPPTGHDPNGGGQQYDSDEGWGFTSVARPDVPDPMFLSRADRAEAANEITTLRKIPKASDYLPAEALAWQRTHPSDPRAPELLGQAFRVVRNACSDKTSTNTEHQLFDTLHRSYSTNHWTVRYRSWE